MTTPPTVPRTPVTMLPLGVLVLVFAEAPPEGDGLLVADAVPPEGVEVFVVLVFELEVVLAADVVGVLLALDVPLDFAVDLVVEEPPVEELPVEACVGGAETEVPVARCLPPGVAAKGSPATAARCFAWCGSVYAAGVRSVPGVIGCVADGCGACAWAVDVVGLSP